MANGEYSEILKCGAETWNRWRPEKVKEPNLRGANLVEANLSGANLSGAHLFDATLFDANLEKADLTGADLGYARLGRANLSRADLSDARLFGANLERVNLTRAKLIRAYLYDTNLSGANLSGANLKNADLTRADLSGANLQNADLSGANLENADLSRANLNGANLKNAIAAFTKFAQCDLSEVEGLDLVKHAGPSTIGIDTIYASKGNISENFLRGCGIPGSFITEMRSLVDAVDGIQFYSCFISYSAKDEEFARGCMVGCAMRACACGLRRKTCRVARRLHEQIETAIRSYDKLLIVLSEASLQSEWVMDELRKARKVESQSRQAQTLPRASG